MDLVGLNKYLATLYATFFLFVFFILIAVSILYIACGSGFTNGEAETLGADS